jgi:hypothetical protein
VGWELWTHPEPVDRPGEGDGDAGSGDAASDEPAGADGGDPDADHE